MIARKSGDLETGDRDRAMIAAALVKSPLTLNAVDRARFAKFLQKRPWRDYVIAGLQSRVRRCTSRRSTSFDHVVFHRGVTKRGRDQSPDSSV